MRANSTTRFKGAHYSPCRATHPLVFRYREARDDRHGAEAILLTLVNHSKESLQRELLQELYKPDVLEDLLQESELVVSRRKEVVSMVGR